MNENNNSPYAKYLQREAEEKKHPKKQTKKKSGTYTFQYVFSFLIPLVGFILGAILLAKDNEDERSVGKVCIILGIVAVAISTVIGVFAFK